MTIAVTGWISWTGDGVLARDSFEKLGAGPGAAHAPALPELLQLDALEARLTEALADHDVPAEVAVRLVRLGALVRLRLVELRRRRLRHALARLLELLVGPVVERADLDAAREQAHGRAEIGRLAPRLAGHVARIDLEERAPVRSRWARSRSRRPRPSRGARDRASARWSSRRRSARRAAPSSCP